MIQDYHIRACDRQIAFKVDLDPAVVTEYALLSYTRRDQVPEPEVVQVMAKALRRGDVAVDAGANIGFFTLLMSQLVGPAGWVHAFEPWDPHVRTLNRHLALNDVTNVSVYAKALWSNPQKHLFRQEPDSGENKIVLEGNEGCSTVWATTLDHELPHGTAPRLIKIDVEGSELRALEGARQLLEKHHPYVVAEMNEAALEKLDCSQMALRAYMGGLGYETFLLHPTFFTPVLLPPKTKLVTERPNVNVLFCSMDQLSALWPEVGL